PGYLQWAGNTSGLVQDFTSLGDLVYVLNPFGNFEIIDTSVFETVGSYALQSASNKLAIANHYAYIIHAPQTLTILDVLDPTDPHPAGSYINTTSVRDIKVSGPYAYVTDQNGLTILNVTDPANVQSIATYPYETGFYQLQIQGNLVFLPSDQGIHIIDVTDPLNPEFVSSVPYLRTIYDFAVQGRYLYFAAGSHGLRVFDWQLPGREIAYYQTPDEANALTVRGEEVYIADNLGGIQAVKFLETDWSIPPVSSSIRDSGYTKSGICERH
ncbi:MAG TPA: hypothetical protein P5280_11365, partial [Cyclobacteriaceae bacterium]|nr:hypothetical protein [Cyclobacteriaceae bacterium]